MLNCNKNIYYSSKIIVRIIFLGYTKIHYEISHHFSQCYRMDKPEEKSVLQIERLPDGWTGQANMEKPRQTKPRFIWVKKINGVAGKCEVAGTSD